VSFCGICGSPACSGHAGKREQPWSLKAPSYSTAPHEPEWCGQCQIMVDVPHECPTQGPTEFTTRRIAVALERIADASLHGERPSANAVDAIDSRVAQLEAESIALQRGVGRLFRTLNGTDADD
jgi:hypothetical protein